MSKGCRLEDFRQLKDIVFHKKFLKYIKIVADSCDFEVCGVLTLNKLYFLKNHSLDIKNEFVLCPSTYYSFYDSILCVFHSHVYGSPDMSPLDIDSAKNSLLPQLIYSKPENSFLYYDINSQKKFIFGLSCV